MKLAYNLSLLNGSATSFLQKTHTKLCMQVDKAGKISVKKWVYKILQFFPSKSFRSSDNLV